MPNVTDQQKRAAAVAAAMEIPEGATVGLGTGSTVTLFVRALAERRLSGLRCVATSPRTEDLARELGLPLEPFDAMDHLDVAVDGTDQVTPDWWLVKGGGGAHTREKVVAAAAARFVVIASEDKMVPRLAPPVPLELLGFGLHATLRRLGALGPVRVRPDTPPSPDGNVIADYLGPVEDPRELIAILGTMPGLVDHGLFPPELVSAVLIGRTGDEVLRLVRDDGAD